MASVSISHLYRTAAARITLAAIVTAGLLAGAPLSENDVESWVAAEGGSVTKNSAGHITEINLRASWITDIDVRKLETLEHLERLDLSQTHISDIALESVAKLPRLKQLDLFFCEHITGAGAARLRGVATLERLNVRGTKISDSGVEFISTLSNLRALDLGITQITDPSLEHLERLEKLEELSIGGDRISEAGLAYLQSLPNLRRLDLSGSQVTDSGIWGVALTDINIGLIASLSGLEHLNLAAADQQYVANIGDGVPRIRNRIHITDLGLAKLQALTELRFLNLTRSDVSAAGLREIASLPALEELILSHSKRVDDEAASVFAEMESLTALDLSGTGITDDGLQELSQSRTLRRLVVTDTSVTADGVEKLRRANPDCTVVW